MKTIRHTNVVFIWSFLLLYFVAPGSIAQVEQEQDEYQKSFDSFNKTIQQDFDAFKHKNDSIFYRFLEQSWIQFDLFKDQRPTEPKPEIQPVMNPEPVQHNKIEPIRPRTILEDSGRQMILNGKPPVYKSKAIYDRPTGVSVTFDFYGTPIEIDQPKTEEKDNPLIGNSEIAEKYKRLSQDDIIIKIIRMLENQANEQYLNGWGTLDLYRKASGYLYATVNDQVLFTWFALLKTGYEVRVGYDRESVYLMAAFDVPAFYRPYFELKGIKYYLVIFDGQNPDVTSITSYEVDYPERLSYLTLSLERYPSFVYDPGYREVSYRGEEIELAFNKNLTDFYKGYPEIDLPAYFQPRISAKALSEFEAFIWEHITKKSEEQQVNFFLDFIQHAFAYRTDEQQFGFENYLFAEETLSYPYTDCEDRTVLLEQLLKTFLEVQTIAIVYPGHVLLGVSVGEPVEGTYVDYEGKKYYVADPTYIGAKLGMIMPEFRSVKPEIIDLKKLEIYKETTHD